MGCEFNRSLQPIFACYHLAPAIVSQCIIREYERRGYAVVTQTPLRKLAVLLHADVVNSTSLVKKNETIAHDRIQDTFHRFSKTISNYDGIAHEIRGDALVAEFSRASDAVSASIAFQTANTTHNEQLSGDIQPVLRIGIAMGEVVVADNTVTGEGIVLAQRLEQLAETGGVVVQGSVSETVPTRFPFEFDSLGEQMLKGFDQPIRAFAVQLKRGEQIPDSESSAVIPEFGTSDAHERPPLALPDKPSIAVLPFTNMSNEPEQDYFADGIAEDIITALSRLNWLFVIARNSSFAYKNRSVDIRQIAHDLGVRYVLEGSVRKGGDRVRIRDRADEIAIRIRQSWRANAEGFRPAYQGFCCTAQTR